MEWTWTFKQLIRIPNLAAVIPGSLLQTHIHPLEKHSSLSISFQSFQSVVNGTNLISNTLKAATTMADESKVLAQDQEAAAAAADAATPKTKSSRFALVFGGKGVVVGPRISPILEHMRIYPVLDAVAVVANHENADAILARQLAAEASSAIQYRTCSWQKTAGLLFSEYICLAIMSFPWSYSFLGLIPGLIITLLVAGLVLYTSLVLWEFCLRHPEVRDVCDIGQMLFWGKQWAWWATAAMFVLNNTFIQALHVLVGAEYLNTMTAGHDFGGCRTVWFSVIVTLICWLASLPRTFSMMSKLGTASAAFTFISVVLATVFAGIQKHPAGYDPDLGKPVVTIVPFHGRTFVTAMAGFLNISYTFIGQITIPSFIAEMHDPRFVSHFFCSKYQANLGRDFPKALWACTIGEIIVFSIVGAVIYAFTGDQYVTSPAFGSLDEMYKKVSFSFMVPTIIFLGCLYASVTGRFVFFRIFKGSRHMSEHTLRGWVSWGSILLVTWVLAFLISQVIPIFSSREFPASSLIFFF